MRHLFWSQSSSFDSRLRQAELWFLDLITLIVTGMRWSLAHIPVPLWSIYSIIVVCLDSYFAGSKRFSRQRAESSQPHLLWWGELVGIVFFLLSLYIVYVLKEQWRVQVLRYPQKSATTGYIMKNPAAEVTRPNPTFLWLTEWAENDNQVLKMV